MGEVIGASLCDGRDDRAEGELVERVRRLPHRVAGELLFEQIVTSGGQRRRRLVALHRACGFAHEAVRGLRAWRWRRRVKALRLVGPVASEAEFAELLERAKDAPLVRVLAAQSFARLGRADHVVTLLAAVKLDNPLMEAPLAMALEQLTTEDLGRVLARWDAFVCSRVQRRLLITATRRGAVGFRKRVEAAAQSPDFELRIGACDAAGNVDAVWSRHLLFHGLRDIDWRVRAHAAKRLGRCARGAAIDSLAEALGDSAFWVRQNAARALRRCGREGLIRLARAARGKESDPFAAQVAAQELHRERAWSRRRPRTMPIVSGPGWQPPV